MAGEHAGAHHDDGPVGRPTSHSRAKLLMSRAWDDELNEHEQRELEEHLSRCPDCTAAAKRMKALLALLDGAMQAGRKPDRR